MDEELANSNIFDDEEDTIEGQRYLKKKRMRTMNCAKLGGVIKGTPWFFNRHLILLQRLEKGEWSLQVPLYFTEFWVQIHYLSRGFMSEGMARQLGDFIGKFMEVPIRMRQMEDCKWLREDRSSSKSIVGGTIRRQWGEIGW
ncbi:hypothetical protein Goari_014406, partial [Gossypium aridum]|nr:hypothetical protein [Gossypium aridum]